MGELQGENHIVTGAYAGLTIFTAEPLLPSWWQVAPGGCRSSALALRFATPAPAGCADPWGGLATGSVRCWTDIYCVPGAIPLDVFASMPEGRSRALTYARYALFRIAVSRSATVGGGSCAGCASRVCFSGQGIGLLTAEGQRWYSTFGTASWQGAACVWHDTCARVGTVARPSTWGAVKALYR